MILHTLSAKTTQQPDLLRRILIDPKITAIVFLGDACYALIDIEQWDFKINKVLYALQGDCEARGIYKCEQNNIKLINYNQFVALSLSYTKVQAWP